VNIQTSKSNLFIFIHFAIDKINTKEKKKRKMKIKEMMSSLQKSGLNIFQLYHFVNQVC